MGAAANMRVKFDGPSSLLGNGGAIRDVMPAGERESGDGRPERVNGADASYGARR